MPTYDMGQFTSIASQYSNDEIKVLDSMNINTEMLLLFYIGDDLFDTSLYGVINEFIDQFGYDAVIGNNIEVFVGERIDYTKFVDDLNIQNKLSNYGDDNHNISLDITNIKKFNVELNELLMRFTGYEAIYNVKDKVGDIEITQDILNDLEIDFA